LGGTFSSSLKDAEDLNEEEALELVVYLLLKRRNNHIQGIYLLLKIVGKRQGEKCMPRKVVQYAGEEKSWHDTRNGYQQELVIASVDMSGK